MSQYWAAIHTHPQAEPDAQREIEDIGIGTFLPSFTRYFQKGAKLKEKRRPLLPGYMFVALEDGSDAWGQIQSIEGIRIRVLTNGGEPVRIPGHEIATMMLDHAQGVHNVIDLPRRAGGRYTKRRRRPRHGRAIRERMRAELAA